MAFSLEELLKPISDEHPSGEYLNDLPEWQKINEARRTDRLVGKQNWDWKLIDGLVSEALVYKTKDLRLGVWLLETQTRLRGFDGLCDGMKLLRGLIENFWDSGLFPEEEGGNLEERANSVNWFSGDGLPLAIRQIPLITRTDGERNYSFADYQQSRSIGLEKDTVDANGFVNEEKQKRRRSAMEQGGVSGEMFETALQSLRRASVEAVSLKLDEVWEEFKNLDNLIDAKFGNDAPGTSDTREALEQCRRFIAELLERKRKEEPDPVEGQDVVAGNASVRQSTGGIFFDGMIGGGDGGSWSVAEKLIGSGKIQEGLAEMTRLSAQEYGRTRFVHRLQLAEVCLSTGKKRLAIAILEELARKIEELSLVSWESPELLGRVWGRLYQCYKGEDPNSELAGRAMQLFSQLCKLDPFQAMHWE